MPIVTLMAFHILFLFYLVIMQDIWSRKWWLIQTVHLTKTLLLVGTAGHYCKSNTKNVCLMSLIKIKRKNYCRSKLALMHFPGFSTKAIGSMKDGYSKFLSGWSVPSTDGSFGDLRYPALNSSLDAHERSSFSKHCKLVIS